MPEDAARLVAGEEAHLDLLQVPWGRRVEELLMVLGAFRKIDGWGWAAAAETECRIAVAAAKGYWSGLQEIKAAFQK